MNYLIRAFNYLQHHKLSLFTCSAALTALCLLPLWGKPFDMDIRIMLPQGKGQSISRDLSLLEHSPLSAGVFILVQGNASSPEELAEVADQLVASLEGKDINFIDFSSASYPQAMSFLIDNAPRLMGTEELVRLARSLKPERLRAQLAENRRLLISFQGMPLKDLIRRDPIGLRTVLAARFAPFANLPQVRIASGRLISPDAHSLLLTAQTNIPVTDASGSARIINQIASVRSSLPHGITVDLISGHALAVANAETLQRDLTLISFISPLFFAILFLSLIRSPRALLLYFTPLVGLAAAMGAVAASASSLSAIVIAFGAVLLGIAEDYGMYIYFAMASHPERPGEALAAVSKPIIFTAATTCASFAVFLLSDIPGQRQLAVYFLAGLGASVAFSLIVLPQMLSNLPTPTPRTPEPSSPRRHTTLAVCLCVLLTAVCAWGALGLRFDSDLRNLGVMPESVRQAELRLATAFGDVRGRAVLFVHGKDMNEALRRNEQIWDIIRRDLPEAKAVSLAPLLPSVETQLTNLGHWRDFWSVERIKKTQRLVASEAAVLGFTQGAFAPLKDTISSDHGTLGTETLKRYGLDTAATLFAQSAPDGVRTFLTLVPDSPDVLSYFSPEREKELGAHLVSSTRFRQALEQSMKSEIALLLGTSAIVVALLTAILYRNPRRFFIAMTPAWLGLAAVLGWLGATATPLNIFHIAALPLVIGMGVGFGIFLVSTEDRDMPLATRKAMLTTGLSTLGGFGALALAKHPALHSMGLTVLIGIGVALTMALLILPLLVRIQR
jgi:predicted exporter